MTAVSIDELLDVSDLPVKTLIDAGFDGTKYMHDFSCECMLPVLKALLAPTPQEVAVRDTYYKMTLLLQTALVMNTSDHFQSIASVTRSLFELWIDLKILAQDTTGEEVRKYHEFPEIERYRTAEQMVKFVDAHPLRTSRRGEKIASSRRTGRIRTFAVAHAVWAKKQSM
jgi:hypothetical protein